MDKYEGSDKLFKALDKMAGDSDTVCQVEEFAQVMAQRGNRVYRYYYNHQSSVGKQTAENANKKFLTHKTYFLQILGQLGVDQNILTKLNSLLDTLWKTLEIIQPMKSKWLGISSLIGPILSKMGMHD